MNNSYKYLKALHPRKPYYPTQSGTQLYRYYIPIWMDGLSNLSTNQKSRHRKRQRQYLVSNDTNTFLDKKCGSI